MMTFYTLVRVLSELELILTMNIIHNDFIIYKVK